MSGAVPKLLNFIKQYFWVLITCGLCLPVFSQQPQVSIITKNYHRPWSLAELKVNIVNHTNHVLVPESIVLMGKSSSDINKTTKLTKTISGKHITKDKLKKVICGYQLWREKLPPEISRPPQINRKPFGGQQFIVFTPIFPGRRLETDYSFIVPYDLTQVTVTFRYRLFTSTPDLVYSYNSQAKIDKSPNLQKVGDTTWKLTRESLDVYEQLTTIPESGEILLPFPKYENLEESWLEKRQKFQVWPMAFNYKDAVAKANIEKVEQTAYYLPLDCWVFEAQQKTYFITWKEVHSFTGHYIETVQKLNKEQQITISLSTFQNISNIVTALQEKNIEVQRIVMEKDQSHQVALIGAKDLLQYLEVLEKNSKPKDN